MDKKLTPPERALIKAVLTTVFHTTRILKEAPITSAPSLTVAAERVKPSADEAEEVLKQAGL